MGNARQDIYGARSTLDFNWGKRSSTALMRWRRRGWQTIAKLPFSIRILLENVLRKCDGYLVTGT